MLERINEEKTIISTYLSDIIKHSVQYLKSGYPIHLTGPTGIGKTTIAKHIAQQLSRPISIIRGHHNLNISDLIGDHLGYEKKEFVDNYVHSVYKKEEKLKAIRIEGILYKAAKEGHTVIYDEFTRSKPEVNNLFLYILEEGVLPLYGLKQNENYLKVNPNFSVIFTSNPIEYIGVYKSQDALLDRLITINFSHLDTDTELKIIQHRAKLKDEEAIIIQQIVSNIRRFCKLKKEQGPSLRTSIMIGKIAKDHNIEINPTNLEFQRLCYDQMWRILYKCLNSNKKVKHFIIEECTKIAGDNHE